MRTFIHAALLLLSIGCSTAAFGMSTLCQIKELNTELTAIGWDSETMQAKYQDSMNETHAGVVTLVRKHGSGEKINLSFDFGRNYYGLTSVEFIVFPVPGTHRVIGVGYVDIGGVRALTTFIGAYDAVCVTL